MYMDNGPNQFPEKLIPKFILLAMRGKLLPIHGDGSNVRSYLYCEDVAEAFDIVLHKAEVGHVYNIGTQKERRVIDVDKDICTLFSLDAEKVIKFLDDMPLNDQRYYLNDKKLKDLGWSERTKWEEGLKKTMDWYISHPELRGIQKPMMLKMTGVERYTEAHDVVDTKSPLGSVQGFKLAFHQFSLLEDFYHVLVHTIPQSFHRLCFMNCFTLFICTLQFPKQLLHCFHILFDATNLFKELT